MLSATTRLLAVIIAAPWYYHRERLAPAMTYSKVSPAIFLSRPNRFIANSLLGDVVAQMKDVRYFTPNDRTHVAFGTVLREAAALREDFYSITPQLREAVENADPDVVRDLLLGLRGAFPDKREFRHAEGNSAAHLKASAMGSSAMVIIESGKPLLGTWQGVYFCEFDPPRQRRFYVKVEGA